MNGFSKILVANRGEIAVRVMRTARELGYRTVAVYSEADSSALHVEFADEAVCIGPPAAAESYLRAEAILEAARRTGADAIHPGYGFLSENSDFARACVEAGICFIGPPADAIELMGSKRLSKLAMLAAEVPCIPGYQGEQQDDATLLKQAAAVGFPLMVKASAGGGGRGMRLVLEPSELAEQLKTARSEALNAFGSGELILERAVLEPHHIEIQVFADNHGNTVYLGERDCSIQRRHQKVVEEAPSPFVDAGLRERMGTAAVEAAQSCGYRGAGTVEFLVDGERNFYFLEMNTRLQVEHPVTEEITGQDLVAWQIRVAAGEVLPLRQEDIKLTGHAVEVRLYAEDPRQQFLPQTGDIKVWAFPQRSGLRVDHGIAAGQTVSPYYDPMLAKLVAHGESRDDACRKLASALQDTALLGVNSNKQFLENILRHPEFLAGNATTAFIEQHFSADPSMDEAAPAATTLAVAALLNSASHTGEVQGWQNPAGAGYCYQLATATGHYEVSLQQLPSGYEAMIGEQRIGLSLVSMSATSAVLIIAGIMFSVRFYREGNMLWLDDGSGHWQIEDLTQAPAAAVAGAGSGEVKASMDGAIVAINVAVGDQVVAGQTLVVLDAMKMEHPLKSGVAGTVAALNCAVGDQVSARQLLAVVTASEEA
ncbi:acetyl/propionyl/methylcrotonyl-CoA carboxylase subunit alpha [Halieaceae bacterium IMCC14734]|uniref:Acetyl/propionyl/methylcrotonyl-CoA carboxylase subunit alpha n=1 Tax=Candidatus Litorirhabdus singularis TaxID=2518993 RepID=A0ABT3TI84_9GAMM|nr:acetyl/propionyl/methylcrotonyl-CoA carboxylase subunit alpha [Candidatus Litorirhabdus singularis]MCX2981119.1 acetyl/propionyl/methylcrotonyl-CoA carboxylase subunit alpha [Candidatus Litorirhabdus singularis]